MTKKTSTVTANMNKFNDFSFDKRMSMISKSSFSYMNPAIAKVNITSTFHSNLISVMYCYENTID
jgi:hypothetical protein